MIRIARVTVLLCFAIAITVIPRTVRADPRTSYLADQLKSNDDYRVRTQAALALGASGDDAAVKPLCDALGDSNPSVVAMEGSSPSAATRREGCCSEASLKPLPAAALLITR